MQKLVLATEERSALDAQPMPEWWRQVLEQHPNPKKGKVPAWIEPMELPSIRLGEYGLNPQQVTELLLALKQSKLTAPHPLVTALKSHASATSLDGFAWKLFEIWLSEDAPAKDNWAMVAVGLLGNDASVLKLAPLVREMPRSGHHKRAVLGLECLRTIGTDTALMQIHTIAQKVKFKGLKQKAEECMAAIAQSRNLTPEQLEDRIVPDCGLDQRGSRVFDYGSRQFHVVFAGEMQPMVRDGEGKLKPNLPKPKAGDESDLAARAIADWQLLKKQIQAVTKMQVDRLERALINQRRWQLPDFERFLVHHPLMTNLTQRLVWGVYDETGQVSSFRVTEDLTYADAKDELFQIAEVAQVGVVHPAQLAPDLRATWGELFSDYELIQPFRQLSRTVFTLKPDEYESQVIHRFQGIEVPAMILSAILKKTGWNYIFNQSNRRYYHCKSFSFANVTAVIDHPREVYLGYDSGSIELNTCFFVPGLESTIVEEPQKLPLKEVDPVVISEVLRNLGAIVAKSE